MKEIKLLSLIIPAYNQEKTIKANLAELEEAVITLQVPYEIIVVVDGYMDKTRQQAEAYTGKHVTVSGYEQNHGKGYAVRFGAKLAQGDIVGFIDAGMDIDPNGIAMLLSHMEWYDADIVIGSKLHPVSQVDYPFTRKILSWGYRQFTHLLFGFQVRDTQVGIKFFKRKVVQDVFPKLLVKKFAFDIEILAVAYSMGYTRIFEAPIKLKFSGNSSIKGVKTYEFWHVIFLMLWDTAAVYYRLKILHYYRKKSHT